jgi:Rrf2 family transcriptional regulator, nitric oxide-sensitive transcriptional repressor
VQLTLHADYAFRVLIYLASHPDHPVISTEEISRSYGISRHHLVRVVKTLSEHGYVKLIPGRSGGISLARETHSIGLGDVLRHAEPSLRIVECFDVKTNTCPIISVCQLKSVLDEALQAFVTVLDQYTLADLLTGRKRHALARVFAKQ